MRLAVLRCITMEKSCHSWQISETVEMMLWKSAVTFTYLTEKCLWYDGNVCVVSYN